MVPRRPDQDGEETKEFEKRKYVDYDDPMSTQLREVKKQVVVPAARADPMQINYDDLF